MKRYLAPLALLVLAVFATAAVADTEREIRVALDYYADVWNENDVDALQGYYHQDFVLVNDSGVLPLGQQIDDLKSIGQRGGDRGELSVGNVTVAELGDEHAMAYGLLSLQFEDGSAIDSWFTTVYRKTPFGWKAILTRN